MGCEIVCVNGKETCKGHLATAIGVDLETLKGEEGGEGADNNISKKNNPLFSISTTTSLVCPIKKPGAPL